LPDVEPLPTVPVSLIWPVAAQPTLLPSGAFRDDSLATHVAPDGYLRAAVDAVDAAAEAPVTWAVDPDLVTTATAMAGGYDVVSGDTTVPGATAAADDAATWRESFITATAKGEVMLLPYARPDVEALAKADTGLADTVAAEAQAATTRLTPEISPGAVTDHAWVDGRGLDRASLDALAGAGVTTVIARADAVDPSTSGFARISTTGDDDIDAVLTDPGLDAAISAAVDADDPRAGAAELRQRWAAETALVAFDAAADERDPAPMIAAPPLRWQPRAETAVAVIETWTGVSWVRPTVLSDLDVPDQPPIVEPAPDDGSDALPPSAVAAAATLRTEAERYESLLAEPGGVGDSFDLAALRAASTGWRDDPAAGEAYTSGLTMALTAQLGKVGVTVPESVTLSSHSGVFPLTLTNDLDEPVMLRLDIRSTNVDRLRIGEVRPQRVEAGERATITVSAEAASNGKVPIEVRLVAGDGSPLGPSQRTVVNATDYGTIGWVIMAGAGLVFGWTLIRRAIRSRRAGSAQGESGTPAAGGTQEPAGSSATDPGRPPASDHAPAPDRNTSPPNITGRTRRRPSEPEQVTR
jgi:hypothetical protein